MDHERLVTTGRRDLHGVRERRHARTKVSADLIDQVSHVDWILARRTSDALEAMRDTLEPIEIATHVRDRLRSKRITFALPEQLEPTAER
jgi:hypothetical protein